MTSGPTAARRWLALAEQILEREAPRLDALNLFPVPDADTGTNMLLTLRSARTAAAAPDPTLAEDLGAVLARAGEAALDAARGNSGTLLAVALAAAAEPLWGRGDADVAALARAFAAADVAARSALSDPREGTILTVLTAAADSLAESVHVGTGLRAALSAMVEDARRAVIGTESQLEPLAEAQVVDAGAVGLLWGLEALRAAATGTPVDEEVAAALHGYADEVGARTGAARVPPGSGHAAPGEEVMATIRLTPLDAATLRSRLEAVGDALILAPVGRELDAQGRLPWRVHVHVARARDALDVLAAVGDPEAVAVTDLAVGHPERQGRPPECHEH